MAKPSWDGFESGDMNRLRDKLLRRQVRFQLYAFSPYYRKALEGTSVSTRGLHGIKDLKSLPLVDRSALAAAPDEFVLKSEPHLIQRLGSGRQVAEVAVGKLFGGIERSSKMFGHDYDPVHALETLGTSTEPVPIRLTRRDIGTLATQGRRMLQVAGAGPSDVVLNFLEPVASGGFWSAWLGAVAFGIKQIAPGYVEPERAASLAKSSGATVMLARASDALDVLEASGSLPDLKVVILAPEPVGQKLKYQIHEMAGDAVDIVSTYQFAEGRAVWAECRQGSASAEAGYHTYPDFDVIEILLRRSDALAPLGQPGEVAFTGLDQRGTALLRYRPGDVATGGIRTGRCPFCNRNLDRVLGPIRRTDKLIPIHLKESSPIEVDADVVTEVMAHPGVASWSVEIRKASDGGGRDEVYVHFRPGGRVNVASMVVEIDARLRSEAGFAPSQLITSESITPGFVDRRPAETRRLIIEE